VVCRRAFSLLAVCAFVFVLLVVSIECAVPGRLWWVVSLFDVLADLSVFLLLSPSSVLGAFAVLVWPFVWCVSCFRVLSRWLVIFLSTRAPLFRCRVLLLVSWWSVCLAALFFCRGGRSVCVFCVVLLFIPFVWSRRVSLVRSLLTRR